MFLGAGCEEGGGKMFPPSFRGALSGASPESREELSLSLDSPMCDCTSWFGPSARPGMTGDAADSGGDATSATPGIMADNGAPGLDGACDNSRSHRYCATLVS